MGAPYKTVAFQTLGCKLNFTETSTLARDFTSHGYVQVGSNDVADLYVINTCSVTDNANKKARKAVRRALRKAPNANIAVIGCYAQLSPDEVTKIPGVSIVVGTKEKFNLVDQIEAHKLNGSPVILNTDINSILDFKPSYSYGERTRSFFKVQDGCDYNCSFCTIPLARGKSRSADIQQTLAQAYKISQTEVREIVLTGVNVGDYNNGGNNFCDLIRILDSLNKIKRFRISSIEPNLLTEDIIDFVKKSSSFLPHFHIPLQSGCNKILKLMKRKYNIKSYSNKIHTIRSQIGESCIGADVIVGFPGETDENFEETFNYIKKEDLNLLSTI